MTGLVAASSDRLGHSLDKLTAGDGFELPDESGVGGRFGFSRWPAPVFLRDSGYLDASEGMKDWSVFVAEVRAILSGCDRRKTRRYGGVRHAFTRSRQPCRRTGGC